MFFSNLSTAGKLLLGLGLVAVLLWAVVAGSYATLRSNEESVHLIGALNLENVNDLQSINAEMNLFRARMFRVMVTPDDYQVVETETRNAEERKQELFARLDRLRERNLHDSSLSLEIANFRAKITEYLDTQKAETIPAIRAGNLDRAIDLVLGLQTDRIDAIRNVAMELVGQEEVRARDAIEEVEQATARAMMFYLAAGLASVVLIFAVLIVLNRAIAKPLERITETAERVAEYDLTVEIHDVERRDEVGSLIATTAKMVHNLRNLTNSINEGVNVIVSATTEILATTSQTAASITQTASAITETTATVEEVKQTAQLSSQKAKSVSESAQRANELAKTGGKAVGDMADGMRAIREDFRGIVENIMQLSTQSHGIGSIIATVDDIAEQSNVLAVNAAIEAAKAGEHGKSFAVVAQEVRNLSEQSKEATRQVRQLLNEIQRGISTAGMATEQGSKAVEQGIRQAEDATKSITQLMASISDAAQAAIQIAASSQQQLVGMDQVAMAMESIRSASEQNVTATRQVEESSRMVSNLGRELKELVHQYKMPGTQG
jgi:methyl-accepting chemotaxis protein